jgi:hypothetical protein
VTAARKNSMPSPEEAPVITAIFIVTVLSKFSDGCVSILPPLQLPVKRLFGQFVNSREKTQKTV